MSHHQSVLPLSYPPTNRSTAPIKTYYAVRSGYNVKNCLFFSWEDCKRHVVPDSFISLTDGVEYHAFSDFHQAELYLFPNNATTNTTTTTTSTTTATSSTDPAADKMKPGQVVSQSVVPSMPTATATATAVPAAAAAAVPAGRIVDNSLPHRYQTVSSASMTCNPSAASTRKNHEKPGTKWMSMLNKLLQFYQANRHTRIPDSQRELLAWSKKQRTYYRLLVDQKPTPMTALKIQLLSSAGFNFDGESAIASSQKSVSPKASSHSQPDSQPHHQVYISPPTKQQVPTQNLITSATAAANSTVTSGTLPYDTDHPSAVRSYKPTKHWNRCFDRLHAYKLSHNGSIEIHKIDTENADLHQWCTEQQAQFKAWKMGKGNYLQEKIERLESIGFVFNYKSWEERIEMLTKYREEKIKTMQNRAYGKKTFETHGIIKIPESHPELGKW